MTQPVWPFSLAHPSGYADGIPVLGTEIEKIQQQGAAAADGRVWTDLAVIKNWKYQPTGLNSISPKSLLRDPVSRRWFIFGGNSAVAQYSCDGNAPFFQTANANFGDPTPTMQNAQAAAVSSAGVMLAGGQLVSSSTAKLRESTDGGLTWLTQRNIGASNTNPVNALAYIESLSLWLCSVGSVATPEGIFSSSDRITWTNRSSLMPSYFAKAELPSTVIIANGLVVAGSTANYGRSTNGTTWSTETFPENVSSNAPCWSDYWGKFFMSGATGIWSSSTGLTGSWSKINSNTLQASLGAFGRLLIRGDGHASLDAGVTWFRVVDTNSLADWHVTCTPYGVGMARGSTEKAVLLSLQIGF